AVREHVSEVAAAAAAVHLRAHHAVAAIDARADGAVDRLEEARPAGAALELRAAPEERLAAAGARERALPLLVKQRARAGALRRVPAQHSVLLRRQQAAPLLVRLLDRESLLAG